MSRALIIGCGYLGTRVARHLLRNGFQVTATTRGKPPETRGKPPETRGVDHRAVSFAQPDLQTLDSTFSHVLYTVPPLAGVDPERPVSWIRQHLEDSNSWIGYVSTTAVAHQIPLPPGAASRPLDLALQQVGRNRLCGDGYAQTVG